MSPSPAYYKDVDLAINNTPSKMQPPAYRKNRRPRCSHYQSSSLPNLPPTTVFHPSSSLNYQFPPFLSTSNDRHVEPSYLVVPPSLSTAHPLDVKPCNISLHLSPSKRTHNVELSLLNQTPSLSLPKIQDVETSNKVNIFSISYVKFPPSAVS